MPVLYGLSVQMVAHDGESAHGNGEMPSQHFDPILDPLLAVLESFTAQKRPPHAAQ